MIKDDVKVEILKYRTASSRDKNSFPKRKFQQTKYFILTKSAHTKEIGIICCDNNKD